MKRVSQIEAKRGEFIDSYADKDAFLKTSARLEIAARNGNIKRELVYIVIPVKHKVMWQIFLMP